jgi:hypothetical protein
MGGWMGWELRNTIETPRTEIVHIVYGPWNSIQSNSKFV